MWGIYRDEQRRLEVFEGFVQKSNEKICKPSAQTLLEVSKVCTVVVNT